MGSHVEEGRTPWRGRLRRPARAACAALVAAATLTGTGLAVDSALAGAGAGNAGGGVPTGAGQMYLTWRYQDNNDGGFGPSTDANSVRRALLMDWPRLEGKADQWINEALNEANANCVARYNEAHHDGQAQCRVVAVGAVGEKIAAGNRFGYEAGADHGIWMNAWNQIVKANNPYRNNGVAYYTSDQFKDQAGWSVDRLADEYSPTWINGTSTGTIVVIAMNQYEPLGEQDYNLSVDTKAGNLSVQAGDTADATDTITLSRDRDVNENVNGTATLHWRGPDGTEKTASKSFTAANNGTVTVSASYRDMDASWEAWPAGARWWDISIPKQGRIEDGGQLQGRVPLVLPMSGGGCCHGRGIVSAHMGRMPL